MKKRIFKAFALMLIAFVSIQITVPLEVLAVNPYMPLWEHIPDAEPYVFEDPDNPDMYRIYVYGSHDTKKTAYCGEEVPSWSAPVDNPTDWRYDGPCFIPPVVNANGQYDTIYAPDVQEVYFGQKYIDYMNAHPELYADTTNPAKILTMGEDGGRWYYMYPNNQASGRQSQVARSRRPDGPFEVVNKSLTNQLQTIGPLGFDPGVYFEEDETSPWGFRAYGFWGFNSSYAVELNPDMYSELSGSRKGGSGANGFVAVGQRTAGENGGYNFYEASSMRKIEINGVKKYLFIYSGYSGEEYGTPQSNKTLRYAYGDSPMGPWKSGGVIVDARGPVLDQDGKMIVSGSYGNTHGSIAQINGQWYVFYHRCINRHEYSRQAMVDPINIEITSDGDVLITGVNTMTATDGSGNVYKGAEVTSQGFELNGLNPYQYYSAGVACWVTPARTSGTTQDVTYVQATYDVWNDDAPVVNIKNGSIVGYKYFNFNEKNNTRLDVWFTPKGYDVTVDIMMDAPWTEGTHNPGVKIGELSISGSAAQVKTKFSTPVSILNGVSGKHGIYFVFNAISGNAEICQMNGLGFSCEGNEISAPTATPSLSIYADGNPLTLPTQPTNSTNANGLADFTYYDVNYSHTGSTAPRITADTSDGDIVIDVMQASAPNGIAIVKFTKNGFQSKYYYIRFQRSDLPAQTGYPPFIAPLVRDNPNTFCNPINISYQYQGNFNGRESADPNIIEFKGDYYLFASHGTGYWWTNDLVKWNYVYAGPDQIANYATFAPGACVVGDTLYLTYSQNGSMYKSTNPKDGNSWTLVGRPANWQDPALFTDDDGRVYLYQGLSGSATSPITVMELDPNNDMALIAGPFICFYQNKAIHGFEVVGDQNLNYNGNCYMEGSFMTKYNGKYYLQYAVPGTEWDVYANGCYVSDTPIGPFTFCENSPISYKSTGFMVGSGHGSLMQDLSGNWWKFDTVSISIINTMERRLSVYPAKFDQYGQLVTNTSFADYPMYKATKPQDNFTDRPDWNLVSYDAKATASSSLTASNRQPANAFNEKMRDWWSATTGDAGEWIQADLGKLCDISAVQVNFADQDTTRVTTGRDNTYCYRYLLEFSLDGDNWFTIVDKSETTAEANMAQDFSHDYFELTSAMKARFVRLTNKGSVPADGKFAVSGLRLFGNGGGVKPGEVSDFTVDRPASEQRQVNLSWDAADGAEGYIIRFGNKPDSRNIQYKVIGSTSAQINCLNVGVDYYFSIDAYNDSGITPGTVLKASAATVAPAYLAITADGDIYSGAVTVYNFTASEASDISLCVAAYDTSGRLISLSQKAFTVEAYDNQLLNVDLDVIRKNASYVKAFLWKNFIPLCTETIRYRSN